MRVLAGTITLKLVVAAVLEMAVTAGASSAAIRDTLVIPDGVKIRVDGIARAGEWVDADTLEIRVRADWVVPVLLKHDGDALYVAFSNLVRGKEERYPEVLLDVAGNGGSGWDDNDWWLHGSYHNCTGRGEFDVYGMACVQNDKWYASMFPLSSGRIIEFKVALDRMGLAPGPSSAQVAFGLGFCLTHDVNESGPNRLFWPERARIDAPETWARARLAPLSRSAHR